MPKKSEKEYRDDIEKLSTKDLRILNMYYLHIKNERVCFKCRQIFKNIRSNFNIKKYYENKTRIGWESQCKGCRNKENLNRILEYRKDPATFIKSKLSSFKSRAKHLGVPFDLTSEYLTYLFESQDSKCYYTGFEISFELIIEQRNRPHNFTPSLERLDPLKGYVKDNVVWCAYYVNRMKNDLDYHSFLKTCKVILQKHPI